MAFESQSNRDRRFVFSYYPTISYLHCSCEKFQKDLLMFFKDVNLSSKKQILWEKFEVFMKQYSSNLNEVNTRIFRAKPCTEELSNVILNKMTAQIMEQEDVVLPLSTFGAKRAAEPKIDKRNVIKLFTDVVKLISLLYQCLSHKNYRCVQQIFVRYGLLSEYAWNEVEGYQILHALENNSDFIKLLVNLDLISSLKNAELLSIDRGICRILFKFMWMVASINDPDERHYKRLDIMITAKHYFFRENFRGSLKRIYLATIAILAAQLKLMKEDNVAKDYIYRLRLYSTFTSDPLITINEVRKMLYACLFVLEKLPLFEPLYEEFLKILPECSANFEPQNLTDIARCQIRQDIKKCNELLPAAVAKLNLPHPLKEFVLGNVMQMSRKDGTVFSSEEIISKSQLDEIVSENASSELPQLYTY